MMKRKLIIPSLLLLATFPVAAQKLVVEQTTVDVGRTGYEHPITAVFKCRNKSSKKLRISQVKPDCYCVAAEYPKGDIAGGEQFQIQLTYKQCVVEARIRDDEGTCVGTLCRPLWQLSCGDG